ncbi:hypothetical protein B0H14DRAFT_3459116 [Mycena olivaceomarginata]|nr:hypothetical protein B0H14DRAFT_3459116 [Mycena olivaceomarginata]
MSHWTWVLQYRCMEHNLYNSTECETLYSRLPTCLESIGMAFEGPTHAGEPSRLSGSVFVQYFNSGDMRERSTEDIWFATTSARKTQTALDREYSSPLCVLFTAWLVANAVHMLTLQLKLMTFKVHI